MERKILRHVLLAIVFILLMGTGSLARNAVPFDEAFSVIVLGSGGGPREDDISGYMIWPTGFPEEAIVFDPGVLTLGIRRADELGNLWDFVVPNGVSMTREGFILQNTKAYLVSHPHLDHISAMVINSPEDSSKALMGTASTLHVLQEHIFNWKVWPNFGDAGPLPHLNKYRYIELEHGQVIPIPGTSMTVEAYPLAHGYPYTSTAFLIEHQGNYLLLCGDTGPDEIEGVPYLALLWERIAPLLREGTLRGMFLEIAYLSDRPNHLLFGHLTPFWLMEEMQILAKIVNPENPGEALRNLRLVVTHVKPVFRNVPSIRHQVEKELWQRNDLGIQFIIPYQGHRMDF